MAIRETKGNATTHGKTRLAQCFYTAADYAKSVNLAVTQSLPGAAEASEGAREAWNKDFGRYRGDEAATEAEPPGDRPQTKRPDEVEDERARPPQKIAGVGEEAFWMGRDALYVLQGDVFIRISIGGPDPIAEKIEKAKALALKALPRLRAEP